MNILIGTLVLIGLAAWVWHKLETGARREQALRGMMAMVRMNLPRMVVAMISAGMYAELLPEALVRQYLGDTAGLSGLLLGTVLGMLTPGGAFVSFALAAGAMGAGATVPAMVAYLTSWGLFSITKMLGGEVSLMGPRFIAQRVAISLPVPLIAGALAMLVA